MSEQAILLIKKYRVEPDHRIEIYDEIKSTFTLVSFLPFVSIMINMLQYAREDYVWAEKLLEKILKDILAANEEILAVDRMCDVVANHYKEMIVRKNTNSDVPVILFLSDNFEEFPSLLLRSIELSRDGCYHFARAHLNDTRIYYAQVAIELICLMDQFHHNDPEIVEILSSCDATFIMLTTLQRLPSFSRNNDRGKELRRIAVDLAQDQKVRERISGMWLIDLAPRSGENQKLRRERLLKLREFYLPLLKYEDAVEKLFPLLSGRFPELISHFIEKLEETSTFTLAVYIHLLKPHGNVVVGKLIMALETPYLCDGASQALINIGEPAADQLICYGIENPSRRKLIQKIFRQMEPYPLNNFFAAFYRSAKEEHRLALVELFSTTESNFTGMVEAFTNPDLEDAAAFFLAWQDEAQQMLTPFTNGTEYLRAVTLISASIGGEALNELSADQLEEAFKEQAMSIEMLANCLHHPMFRQKHRQFLQEQILQNLDQLVSHLNDLDKRESEDAKSHWFVRYVIEHPIGAVDQALVRRFICGESSAWLNYLLVEIGRRTLQHLTLMFQQESNVEAQARQIVQQIRLTEKEKYPWVISILAGRTPDEAEAVSTLRLLSAAKFPHRLEAFSWALQKSQTSQVKKIAIEGIAGLNCRVSQSVFEDVMEAALDDDTRLNIAATKLLIVLGEKFNMKADDAAHHRVKERIKRSRQRSDRCKQLNAALSAIS